MNIIDELRAFVFTAQTGSFTAAADRLAISNRLTSKYVANLEARLNVRLLQRTTRSVGLTPAGEELLGRAPLLLQELDGLLATVSNGAVGYSGIIRISAPVSFGEVYICEMLARFAELHPKVKFDLRLSDNYCDLAREGVDLAFRIGESDMLSLKSRKLGVSQSVLVASPEYIEKHGRPMQPAELEGHRIIIDTNRRGAKHWRLTRGDEAYSVNLSGTFQVNSAKAAAALALKGIGIAEIPRFAISSALFNGELVQLLADFETQKSQFNAVYLEGSVLPRKVRALIDFAVTDIRAANIL